MVTTKELVESKLEKYKLNLYVDKKCYSDDLMEAQITFNSLSGRTICNRFAEFLLAVLAKDIISSNNKIIVQVY